MKKGIIEFIICLMLIILGFCIILKSNKEQQAIEYYCSLEYKYDVEQYKSCRSLKILDLLAKLSEEAKTKYDIPSLGELKFDNK